MIPFNWTRSIWKLKIKIWRKKILHFAIWPDFFFFYYRYCQPKNINEMITILWQLLIVFFFLSSLNKFQAHLHGRALIHVFDVWHMRKSNNYWLFSSVSRDYHRINGILTLPKQGTLFSLSKPICLPMNLNLSVGLVFFGFFLQFVFRKRDQNLTKEWTSIDGHCFRNFYGTSFLYFFKGKKPHKKPYFKKIQSRKQIPKKTFI